MAPKFEDEEKYRATLENATQYELIAKAREIKHRLNSEITPREKELAVEELKIVVSVSIGRGMGNPLAPPDPMLPPPIPGVKMPPPAQAPKPPSIPSTPAPVTYSPTTGLPQGAQMPPGGMQVTPRAPARAPQAKKTPGPSLVDLPREERACWKCPSFISSANETAQIKKFGKATGVHMCAALHIPLSSMQEDPAVQGPKIASDMAKDCHRFGVAPEVSNPESRELFGIIAPMHKELSEQSNREKVRNQFPNKPGSCTSCTYYLGEEKMLREYGFTQSACSLKGMLIPLGAARDTANNCSSGHEDFAHSQANSVMLELLPVYRKHISPQSDDSSPSSPSSPSFTATGLHPDPLTYPTDKEVTIEDQGYGIRAWRKLLDPEKGSSNFVYMPIFDRDSFSAEEQEKIPTAGRTPEDDHPELYEDHFGLLYATVVLWTKLHETPALNGVAGTGKTEFFRYAAYSMGLPFERFSITNSTELDELQGRMTLVATETGNKTEFVYGRVSQAWGKRCVLAIDEPNTGPNDVWQFFRPLTDNSKQLVLDVNNGERLERNKYCLMGMAFNPAWDMRNVGTHEIGDADGSRLMHISVPMPKEDQERRIIKRRCELDGYKISKETLDAVMNIAKELRSLSSQDAFPVHWGIRNQIKVARATAWFPMSRAYRLAAGDLLSPEYCDQLLAIVKSHTPSPKTQAATPPGRSSGGPRMRPRVR